MLHASEIASPLSVCISDAEQPNRGTYWANTPDKEGNKKESSLAGVSLVNTFSHVLQGQPQVRHGFSFSSVQAELIRSR
jgi:hypothetical protein